jgi:hypothetical protein
MNGTPVWTAALVISVVLALAVGARLGGGRFTQGGGSGPTTSEATIDIACGGGKTITISTGTNSKGAECQVGTPPTTGVCNDGQGNSTEASCEGGCLNAHGAASCKIKQ